MAESKMPETSLEPQQMQHLAELRQTAQLHLTQIEQEHSRESQEESRRQQDLERYRKVSRTKSLKEKQMEHRSRCSEGHKLRRAQGRLAQALIDSMLLWQQTS